MKGLIDKLANWGLRLMNHRNYEQQIKSTIYDTIIDELNQKKSCRCNLLITNNQKKRNTMLKQIMSNQDIKLIDREILTVIYKTADIIQNDKAKEYPVKNANDAQIKNFAENVSKRAAKYFSLKHTNTLTLSTDEVPNSVMHHLNNKELSNIKFTSNNNNIQINLTVNGSLVSGGQNTEVTHLNTRILTIFGIGLILDFFNIHGLNKKIFHLKNPNFTYFDHNEDYINIDNLFSNETESLAERISIDPSIESNLAEKFFISLSNTLNNTYSDNLIYSLNWYCKSLNFVDIKNDFICLYIGFEALSGIWTKAKKEKSKQDKIKCTIAALLAKNPDDFQVIQKFIAEIIDLRNELIHGEKSEIKHDEFDRKIRHYYAQLGQTYRDLFLYTINKINSGVDHQDEKK